MIASFYARKIAVINIFFFKGWGANYIIFCYSLTGKCSGKNKTRKIMLTLSRLNAPNNILGQ